LLGDQLAAKLGEGEKIGEMMEDTQQVAPKGGER